MIVFDNDKDYYIYCLKRILQYSCRNFEFFHEMLKAYDKEWRKARRKKLIQPDLKSFVIRYAEFHLICYNYPL